MYIIYTIYNTCICTCVYLGIYSVCTYMHSVYYIHTYTWHFPQSIFDLYACLCQDAHSAATSKTQNISGIYNRSSFFLCKRSPELGGRGLTWQFHSHQVFIFHLSFGSGNLSMFSISVFLTDSDFCLISKNKNRRKREGNVSWL